jgi:hypothetical protein
MRPDNAPCCCAHAAWAVPARHPPSEPSPADALQLAAHLYMCQGLSTYRIGEVTGMGRQRVGRLLARAGVPVKPRGAGRGRQRTDRQAALDGLMAGLYAESGLSSVQISALTGVSARTVRGRLRAAGVRMRTRGALNREDRIAIPADTLVQLYVHAGLSASDVGRRLGVSGQVVLRSAHDEGIPVRMGGPEPSRGPAEIELVDALYADPAVRQVLSRHGVAPRPEAGPIWMRFPVPVPLSPELAADLYIRCGLAVRHIELVTGQPSQTVLRQLDAQGITRRPQGGRSPFMRRWRAGSQPGGPARERRPGTPTTAEGCR